MNIPNTMMMKANSRFGAMRSEAGFAIMSGEAVVAVAIVQLRLEHAADWVHLSRLRERSAQSAG
ncbi:hypothetical protein S23_16960 [Bradyrhizobium cosmicum]|uniref:Uncharacterized protein n=1 Tax=Bradyrhizobium cosmicum TaxID=1404864 RepID=A0AAI8MBI4_9BRAD|nr:hypothetical protein S23_16960 [Bradyrhizobium cosmicum]